MIKELNPLVRYARAFKVGLANTKTCVGRENRIFYITAGEANLVISGKSYSISKNTLVYIPSYTEYRFEFKSGGGDVSLVCLNFDICARDGSDETHKKPIPVSMWNGDTSDGERTLPEFSKPIVIPNAEGAQKDINKLNGLYSRREPYYADFASVYMKKILLFTLTRAEVDDSPTTASRILEYVRENYRENIRNSELAKRFGYHPNHLNRVVKAYTGMSLKSYIITCKLSAAKEQLAMTDDQITEISENCGFSTPSYFTELFSRSEGITPREYRNKMRNMIV